MYKDIGMICLLLQFTKRFCCGYSIRVTSKMTSSSPINNEGIKRPLNFSIDHILNNAGQSKQSSENNLSTNISMLSLPWLQCTRYCPPKVPRRKDPPQRRQLGRHPRIPFTTHQLAVLEEHFKRSPYLSSQEVKELSRDLDLADIRVKIWFQNRRARERREGSTKQDEIEKGFLENQKLNFPSRTIAATPSIGDINNQLEIPSNYNFSMKVHQRNMNQNNLNFVPNKFQSQL